MAFDISKSIVQSTIAAFIVFFGALFLQIAGISLFSEQALSSTGFAVILLFGIFNVFGIINWK